MTTQRQFQEILDRLAKVEGVAAERLSSLLIQNPALAEELDKQIEALLETLESADSTPADVADGGLAQLVGIGPGAGDSLGDSRLPRRVTPYDEAVSSERIVAVADLYYIYQHEVPISIFRVIRKLQELFRSGAVRLSSGDGAYRLYQFDRRDVLRYTRRDRLAAYRRALGYGTAPAPRGAKPNVDFHRLFAHFSNQVARYWRDKRVSDVIRERALDPSFGSIAVVRRAGLDLRNNLKFTSYGHINVLRVEVMQLLEEAFQILDADDVKKLFGAENGWEVVEEVLVRYFNKQLTTSPHQRMAIAGRRLLRWLAQPNILETTRAEFEALLARIAEPAEEWLTSAKSVGVTQRAEGRVMPATRGRTAVGPAATAANGRRRAQVP